MNWIQARRAEKMNPSVIREILKITEKPGIISFAGGLPSPTTFPVGEFSAACEKVLREDGHAALQYAASEGYAPLRDMVAAMLPWQVDPALVLITTGSQQGLDLIAKVLIDGGSRVLVETPTYLGALQAFTPMEPDIAGVACDDSGVDLDDLAMKAPGARFFYVLPNFQNPTGRTMPEAHRAALSLEAARLGLPLVLGSFSKVLAPGLRLGFMVAPASIFPKLLQAKQAADLHSPGFNQRLVAEVMKDGFLDRHVPTIRTLYKSQRDTMLAAMAREMPEGVEWNTPAGGMFLWVRLPAGMNAVDLLPLAVARNVAFVPGKAFYAGPSDGRSLRLSFVTSSAQQIDIGIAALGGAIRDLCDGLAHSTPRNAQPVEALPLG